MNSQNILRRHVLIEHVKNRFAAQQVNAQWVAAFFQNHVVSPRLDNLKTEGDSFRAGEWTRWPIICGHLGRCHHRFIADLDHRVVATLIREPVARTRFVYTYFRYNVRPSHGSYHEPELVAARELDFSEFIRQDSVRKRIADHQFQVLCESDDSFVPDGDSHPDLISQVCDSLLSCFDIVGVTDRLAAFFDSLLQAIDVAIDVPSHDLIKRCHARKSEGSVTVSDDDRAFIQSINRLDSVLYQRARASSTTLCSTQTPLKRVSMPPRSNMSGRRAA